MNDDDRSLNPYRYAHEQDGPTAHGAIRPKYIGFFCSTAILLSILGLMRQTLTIAAAMVYLSQAPGQFGAARGGGNLFLFAMGFGHVVLCVALLTSAIMAWKRHDGGRRGLVSCSSGFFIFEVVRLLIFIAPLSSLQEGLAEVEQQVYEKMADDPNVSEETIQTVQLAARFGTYGMLVLGALYGLALLAFYGAIVAYFKRPGVLQWYASPHEPEQADASW